MIPNRANHLWLQADQPGYFWGQCAEFCGESHAVMRFRVIALGPREFNDWLAQQRPPARPCSERPPSAARGAPRRATPFAANETGASGAFDAAPLDAWRAKQFPAEDENPALIAKGRQLFADKTCISCHTIRGVQAALGCHRAGPDPRRGPLHDRRGPARQHSGEIQRWIHNPDS